MDNNLNYYIDTKRTKLLEDMKRELDFYTELLMDERILISRITIDAKFANEVPTYNGKEKNTLNGIRDKWVRYKQNIRE